MDYVEIVFSILMLLVTLIGVVVIPAIRQNSRKIEKQIKKLKMKMEVLKDESQQGENQAA